MILKEQEIVSWAVIPGYMESTDQVAKKAMNDTMQQAGITAGSIGYIIATGIGQDYVTFADQKQPESICLASGIDYLLPSTRTLIDLGTRKSLAIKCHSGKTLKTSASNKCATSTGTYLKMVANIFNLTPEEMSSSSFNSRIDLEIQNTCAVFAESEIISLIHNGSKYEDILKGVFRGLAERIFSQLLDIGIEKEVTIVGGFAKNKAIVAALESAVGFPLQTISNPLIVGALGAALIGQKKRRETPC